MSAEDVLSDGDRALLDHLDEEMADAEDVEDYEAIVGGLRAELREHNIEFRRFKRNVAQRLDDLEADVEDATTSGGDTEQEYGSMTELERLAQLSPEMWEEELSTSKVIALTLHTNWNEIAWSMGDADNRKVGVDTNTTANAKYNPSKLKFRLKKELDWEPEWEQIYRGLKTLAKLSNGEEYVKNAGRVQVIGETYIYAEKATPDAKQTKRVVWRKPA